jgi:hypothetical protein
MTLMRLTYISLLGSLDLGLGGLGGSLDGSGGSDLTIHQLNPPPMSVNLRILGSNDLGLGLRSRDSRGLGLDRSRDSSVGSKGGTGDLGRVLDGSFGRSLDGSGYSKGLLGSDGVRLLGLSSAYSNKEEMEAYLGGLDLLLLGRLFLGSKELGKEAFTLGLGLFDLVLYVSLLRLG